MATLLSFESALIELSQYITDSIWSRDGYPTTVQIKLALGDHACPFYVHMRIEHDNFEKFYRYEYWTFNRQDFVDNHQLHATMLTDAKSFILEYFQSKLDRSNSEN